MSVYLENCGFKLVTLVPVNTAACILVLSLSVLARPCLTHRETWLPFSLILLCAQLLSCDYCSLLHHTVPSSAHWGSSTLPAFPLVHPAPQHPSQAPTHHARQLPTSLGTTSSPHSDVSGSGQPAPPAKWMLPFPASGFKSMHRASFLFCLGSDSVQRTSLCSTPNL